MYRYLLIESRDKIESHKSLLLEVLQDVMTIKDIEIIDNVLLMIYEDDQLESYKEILMNLSVEAFIDFKVYESYKFIDIETVKKHSAYISSLLKDILFNESRYFYDVDVVTTLLTKIKPEDYHYFLKSYITQEDMKNTLKVYLESNQNMSEASKKLFIHRNTLIQRIDKFISTTGFDIKKFVDGYVIYYMLTH